MVSSWLLLFTVAFLIGISIDVDANAIRTSAYCESRSELDDGNVKIDVLCQDHKLGLYTQQKLNHGYVFFKMEPMMKCGLNKSKKISLFAGECRLFTVDTRYFLDGKSRAAILTGTTDNISLREVSFNVSVFRTFVSIEEEGGRSTFPHSCLFELWTGEVKEITVKQTVSTCPVSLVVNRLDQAPLMQERWYYSKQFFCILIITAVFYIFGLLMVITCLAGSYTEPTGVIVPFPEFQNHRFSRVLSRMKDETAVSRLSSRSRSSSQTSLSKSRKRRSRSSSASSERSRSRITSSNLEPIAKK
ncbi:unnamed protein product [Bursaphelenchus xylophilus]|uniref:(pine wood nematode) hypothetical protein n=1 Tax=Bursaphelenchus xylophilus TaxID=6326 RepID=A0A1I7S4Q5_BURXY|nr:unnamed protein product [Bursaphelenchus xylophilus]CAG9117301.1 unnamed protein product [Bursaphelenchus xylophilus]